MKNVKQILAQVISEEIDVIPARKVEKIANRIVKEMNLEHIVVKDLEEINVTYENQERELKEVKKFL